MMEEPLRISWWPAALSLSLLSRAFTTFAVAFFTLGGKFVTANYLAGPML